ncbi:MAG TPA: PIG-L family deacetylase, partial [Phycisphaerae bacterium]|nr:PIG-L family deacetylase [Phycisphaerae bacterium]
QSYLRFMAESLFDHIDIDPANVHVPDGTLAMEDVEAYCRDYEAQIREAGGLDLQILGIGRTGHIGFNEPGSSKRSRTRLITLDRVTRMDAASDFFGERHVPRRAVTMGVGTILEAKRIILMAFGEQKASILARAIEGDVTPAVAASFLQEHSRVDVIADRAAASALTAIRTPWLLGPISKFDGAWDTPTIRRAVIWLSMRVDKPILKLVEEDYNENGLQGLIASRGSAYDINIEVFRRMQNTITGWPGGKPNGDAAKASSDVYPKRIIVFSPHPDDDVISMGGTLIRLCEQGHEVHVAYQTSGNIAVWDDEAIRLTDFVNEFCGAFAMMSEEKVAGIREAIQRFIGEKAPGDVDSVELQRIKGLIRRTEARAAARFAGVANERIHFLDLPFYETGRVRKNQLSDKDVLIVAALLERVKPHQIYAAGDLSDPHGTHRVCLAAIDRAIAKLGDQSWMKCCDVWHYRGAWQEWDPHEIDMAVPLSPDEVERKRLAVFRHQSQKDKALFPGPSDAREFWQRAEDRNRHTAEVYDKLGLPEYQAIEAFVRRDAETLKSEQVKSQK